MNPIEIIAKKRDRGQLTSAEIAFFIDGVCQQRIADYQLAAWLMAIYINGLTDQETIWLTQAMMRSGTHLTFPNHTVVDKHSTGGVGDKTTLVLAPMLSAAGLDICKLSGRGLGHTGGTLDKLSAFEGFRFDLSVTEIQNLFQASGFVISGQTDDLVPADKLLYAMRDVTATVGHLPLVASSIMSKKLACGCQSLVLDVKCGGGAHMKDLESAEALGKLMQLIGQEHGVQTSVIISNMNQPLGNTVGNNLEVAEAIATLKGDGPDDLVELCLALGSSLLQDVNGLTVSQSKQRLKQTLSDQTALDALARLVVRQGGQWHERFASARLSADVLAPQGGYIAKIDALQLGQMAMTAGAGRQKKSDEIDLSAGIILHCKIGAQVSAGDPLLTIHSNDQTRLDQALTTAQNVMHIENNPVPPASVVLKVF